MDLELAGVGECSNKERTEVRELYIRCEAEKRGEGKIFEGGRTQLSGVLESACYGVDGELKG